MFDFKQIMVITLIFLCWPQ